MNKNQKNRRLTPEDIARCTALEQVRPAQFVQGAFLVSALTISAMTAFSLYQAVANPPRTDLRALGLVQILGLLGMTLWVVGYAVGFWFFKKRTNRDSLEAVLRSPFRGPAALAGIATDADKLSHHLRKTWVMRTGAWEVGPIICLLSVQVAIQGNLVATDPGILTTGVVPMVAFVALCLITWPTQKRQAEILEKAFIKAT